MTDRPAKKAATKKAAVPPPARDDGPTEDNGLGAPEATGIPSTRARVVRDALHAAGLPPFPDHGEYTNIEEALVAFQAQMPKVRRTKTAEIERASGGHAYSYDYADLADLVDAATPLLTSLGFAFTARPRQTTQGGYELVGVLSHICGDQIEGALPIQGRTPQDLGSAITYARRYLYGCLTGLVTDDDDDGAMATATATGPTIEALLARLDYAARQQDTDRDAITAKWREQHGNLAPAMLPLLAPMTLLPLVESIEAWITAQESQASRG